MQKLLQELHQPHIFRDKNLITAENLMMFEEFYGQIWEKLSIIGLAIYQVRACGNGPQDELYEKEFCQDNDQIVCRDQEQREKMVSRREAMIDRWDGKIDNLNNESMRRDAIDDIAYVSQGNDLIMPM